MKFRSKTILEKVRFECRIYQEPKRCFLMIGVDYDTDRSILFCLRLFYWEIDFEIIKNGK